MRPEPQVAMGLALAAELFAAYPGSARHENTLSVSLYAEYLSRESEEVARLALRRAMQGSPRYVPTLPELWNAVDEARAELAEPDRPQLDGPRATPDEAVAILRTYRHRRWVAEGGALEDDGGPSEEDPT